MQLRTKLVVLVMTLLMLLLSVMYAVLQENEDMYVREEVANRARSISRVIALSTKIPNWIENPEKYENIQELAEQLRIEAEVDFVVVFKNDGIRISHPDVQKIGQHIEGNDERRALEGEEYISVAQGSRGKSIRAFCPIFHEGVQVGAVVTGVSMEEVEAAIHKRNMQMLGALVFVFAIGLSVTLLVANKIKKSLLGMEPQALAQMTVERNTIIQSVCEGILVIDQNGFLKIVNDEAKRILEQAGITDNLVGKQANKVIPHTRMMDIVLTGKSELNQEQKVNNKTILTNRVPLIVEGKIVGAIATFRDLNDVKALSEELTGVKNYVEALRARAHEYRNTLHVISGLALNEEYDKLAAYIRHLSLTNESEFKELNVQVKDPVVSAFLQSKRSRSRELGVELIFDKNMYIPEISDEGLQNAMVTILGNLLDNAMEAVQFSACKQVRLYVMGDSATWKIEVADMGCGLQGDIHDVLKKGFSTKGKNRGFGLYLVARTVKRFNGKLGIQPNEPNGTIFCVTLCLEKEKTE